jgi:tRNA U34 5-methylaminomethyl-2-thiouridine-forming methyltransferase MnmC
MKVAPPGHTWVETADGTPTLLSHRFDEHCHSLCGARAETQHHYLEGCEVRELLKQHHPCKILEVGFGTGLGWFESARVAEELHGQLDFLSLELEEELVKWMLPDAKLVQLGVLRYYEQVSPHARLRVVVGDARTTLPQIDEKFHAIYQDAFSPRKNPTLWTHEWFSLLAQKASPEARLATYSASISIRKSLMAAGWGVFNGPQFGTKRRSTRAIFGRLSDPSIIEELALHPIGMLKDAP